MRTRFSKAFTLVEILIVVVILGILAAIVVPQFTNASQDAQISNVETQLSTIRQQVELYRVRNNGQYPACLAAGDWADLTPPTSNDYMRVAPVNPRTGLSTVISGTAPSATDAAGWLWDAATGTLRAARFDEATRAWLD
ncbi:MAG: prepilin-type N-terminal cleavage/methylation domain-containing protein [Phycisphaerae bacterium]|nr:prepilin-type N-terminal cleavage/methylation domain-containing protein [Phycisphaerae bacterium]